MNSPLQNGNYHDDAVTLKEDLMTLGFGDFSKTRFYGPQTEQAVREFQSHFGVIENGIADQPTLQKVEEILSSPLQSGNYHDDAVELKEMLMVLGFGDFSKTTYYGPQTASAVSDFQDSHDLPVSGIADEITITVLTELYNEIQSGQIITTYDITFDEMIEVQYTLNPNPQTDLYRFDNGFVHSDYISNIEESTTITGDGVNLRASASFGDNIEENVSGGTEVEFIKEVNGDEYEGSTTWFEIDYDGDTLYVHSSLAEHTQKGETTARVNVRESSSSSSHSYKTIPGGTEVTIVDESGSWYEIDFRDSWRNSKESDTRSYANPDPEENNINQHMLLSDVAGATGSELDEYLSGKGTLDGQGSAFVDAANEYGVNEAYLIAHAVHETAHGNSELAQGIYVDSDGDPVSDQSNPPSSATKVYNMYGIAAYDGQETIAGPRYAYEQGWTSPEKAIIGGAEWIANRYIYGEYNQNTMYKMRWNPVNTGVRQYATDIGWALKQTSTVETIYESIANPTTPRYDIVEFK
ncbi:peptidoglycan-binding protein, partial [Alkalibacillus haloalkaliphilus]|uniref:Mannosyl-glycoprotein endo-beta-N-acetylglucosamidase-like domain-containing protein n=1 Tax=Alkalibacillus haloalkaliphilus TaxID=94136 RepID=A0A511WAS3_9BACI